MKNYFSFFLFAFALFNFASSAVAGKNSSGCNLTLEITDIKYAYILGQNSHEISKDPDFYLKISSIDKDNARCKSYMFAETFRMNILSDRHPELANLKKGDRIKGAIAPTIQPPWGKELNESFLNNIFITDIIHRKFFVDKKIEYNQSFQHIGVFKEE